MMTVTDINRHSIDMLQYEENAFQTFNTRLFLVLYSHTLHPPLVWVNNYIEIFDLPLRLLYECKNFSHINTRHSNIHSRFTSPTRCCSRCCYTLHLTVQSPTLVLPSMN